MKTKETYQQKRQKLADILFSHVKQYSSLNYISQDDVPDITTEILSALESQEELKPTIADKAPIESKEPILKGITHKCVEIEPRKQEEYKVERPIKKTAEQILIDRNIIVGIDSDKSIEWVTKQQIIEAVYEFHNQFAQIETTNAEINAYAELYPNYLDGATDWNKGMKHGIKHGAKALRDGKI